jgi:hypothetical protein
MNQQKSMRQCWCTSEQTHKVFGKAECATIIQIPGLATQQVDVGGLASSCTYVDVGTVGADYSDIDVFHLNSAGI